MKAFRIGNSRCPVCDALLDGHAHPSDEPPRPGDFCVCGYCRLPLVYAVDPLGQLTLRQIQDSELAEFYACGGIEAMRAAERGFG